MDRNPVLQGKYKTSSFIVSGFFMKKGRRGKKVELKERKDGMGVKREKERYIGFFHENFHAKKKN